MFHPYFCCRVWKGMKKYNPKLSSFLLVLHYNDSCLLLLILSFIFSLVLVLCLFVLSQQRSKLKKGPSVVSISSLWTIIEPPYNNLMQPLRSVSYKVWNPLSYKKCIDRSFSFSRGGLCLWSLSCSTSTRETRCRKWNWWALSNIWVPYQISLRSQLENQNRSIFILQ